MNLNRIDLIGRTTQKPELKTTSSDRKICIFTLAVNGYKNKNGEVHVDFIKCILSGIGAETFVKYVEKGTKKMQNKTCRNFKYYPGFFF